MMITAPHIRPPYPIDIADNMEAIEHRLERFIWAETSHRNEGLRHVLLSFIENVKRCAIVGGMVRDFARVGALGFHSDVDIVIDAPNSEVEEFAKVWNARRNAFGGFSMVAHDWEFDFWPLQSTWAVREGLVDMKELGDIIRTTFFDHDAIAYDLSDRRVICADDYLARQRMNVLEINLLPNPSIEGCLYRAARRIIGWELSAGPKLHGFIDRHLDDEVFGKLVTTERRKKATPILQSFKDIEDLRRVLLTRKATSSAS